jgi:hypothetical protein
LITPFQLDVAWRDYTNLWAPPANAQFAPIADSSCYLPRIRMVPDTSTQIMPPSGKLQYNFTVAPGSIMWAIWAGPAAQLPFTFQLTDIAIGHRLFQEPCSTQCLPNASNTFASGFNPSSYDYALLPTPWPIVGDGLLKLEIWGAPKARYFIILGFAEVNECAN